MTDVRIDPITLDLIENALLNARFEMDEVVRRAAMSPTIRVQHDEFPMICNARGQMVVGQFGSYIPEVIDRFGGDISEGDVILLNDPYVCKRLDLALQRLAGDRARSSMRAGTSDLPRCSGT